jgi:hypothetical protein
MLRRLNVIKRYDFTVPNSARTRAATQCKNGASVSASTRIPRVIRRTSNLLYKQQLHCNSNSSRNTRGLLGLVFAAGNRNGNNNDKNMSNIYASFRFYTGSTLSSSFSPSSSSAAAAAVEVADITGCSISYHNKNNRHKHSHYIADNDSSLDSSIHGGCLGSDGLVLLDEAIMNIITMERDPIPQLLACMTILNDSNDIDNGNGNNNIISSTTSSGGRGIVLCILALQLLRCPLMNDYGVSIGMGMDMGMGMGMGYENAAARMPIGQNGEYMSTQNHHNNNNNNNNNSSSNISHDTNYHITTILSTLNEMSVSSLNDRELYLAAAANAWYKGNMMLCIQMLER